MIVTDATSAQTATGGASASGNSDMDKTAFMKLLVEQLKHQDPMEPMSNTEFVAQLAQFSGVEQMITMNEGIEILQLQQMGMANAQAASFIGKEVEVRSDQLQVSDSDTSVNTAFKLDADAETITVNFRDASGNIVRKMEIGARSAGEVTLEWDLLGDDGSRVPSGTYRVDVVAADVEGNPVSWEATTTGKVTGVSYEAGYPELLLGAISAPLSDVIKVNEGETTP